MSRLRVGIAGASGYGGGELLRLLLFHPGVELGMVTSRRFAGKRVATAHPNLRGLTDLGRPVSLWRKSADRRRSEPSIGQTVQV